MSPEDVIVLDDSGERPGKADSLPRFWATVPPSQADTEKMETSAEKSPSSPVAKKAKVSREEEEGDSTREPEGRREETGPTIQDSSRES